jgi:phosphatidylglycerophosphate synthase
MINLLNQKIQTLKKHIAKWEICQNIQCLNDKWTKRINHWGKELANAKISATSVSMFGFIIGMLSVNFLAMSMYFEALICIIINRFCDILDGAVARAEGITSFGRFIDTTLDFIFYGGVIFGFSLAEDGNAPAACFLLFAFMSSSVAMLTYGIIDKKSSNSSQSPFYLGGLAQGFETVTSFTILCIMPFAFKPIAILLGCWCLMKTLLFIAGVYYQLNIAHRNTK